MSNDEPSQSAADAGDAQKDAGQFVGFALSDQEYAFPIEQIQEIVILEQITQVPQVPAYVEGVSNLRGTIIPIINLRDLFGLPPQPSTAETRTVVVNVGERTMGCTVDSVSQVIRIPADSIQAAPDLVASQEAAYVAGFANLDQRLVIVLNVDELLSPDKLESVHQAARQQADQSG